MDSEVTGKKLNMQFEIGPNERVNLVNTYGIPPHATFILAAPIPSTTPHSHGDIGETVQDYLEKWGGFEFVFETLRHPRVLRRFDFPTVKKLIEQAFEQYGYKSPPPTVRKRDES